MNMDQDPTGPNQLSRADREKLLAEFMQRVHSTGPFHADEFTSDQRTDLKKMFKESVDEWLEDKFAQFGRWAFVSIMAVVFVGLLYFAATVQGWHLSKSIVEAGASAK